MPRPRRTYDIRKVYLVLCSDCYSDISGDGADTQAAAEKARDAHEAWHRDNEKRAAREQRGE